MKYCLVLLALLVFVEEQDLKGNEPIAAAGIINSKSGKIATQTRSEQLLGPVPSHNKSYAAAITQQKSVEEGSGQSPLSDGKVKADLQPQMGGNFQSSTTTSSLNENLGTYSKAVEANDAKKVEKDDVEKQIKQTRKKTKIVVEQEANKDNLKMIKVKKKKKGQNQDTRVLKPSFTEFKGDPRENEVINLQTSNPKIQRKVQQAEHYMAKTTKTTAEQSVDAKIEEEVKNQYSQDNYQTKIEQNQLQMIIVPAKRPQLNTEKAQHVKDDEQEESIVIRPSKNKKNQQNAFKQSIDKPKVVIQKTQGTIDGPEVSIDKRQPVKQSKQQIKLIISQTSKTTSKKEQQKQAVDKDIKNEKKKMVHTKQKRSESQKIYQADTKEIEVDINRKKQATTQKPNQEVTEINKQTTNGAEAMKQLQKQIDKKEIGAMLPLPGINFQQKARGQKEKEHNIKIVPIVAQIEVQNIPVKGETVKFNKKVEPRPNEEIKHRAQSKQQQNNKHIKVLDDKIPSITEAEKKKPEQRNPQLQKQQVVPKTPNRHQLDPKGQQNKQMKTTSEQQSKKKQQKLESLIQQVKNTKIQIGQESKKQIIKYLQAGKKVNKEQEGQAIQQARPLEQKQLNSQQEHTSEEIETETQEGQVKAVEEGKTFAHKKQMDATTIVIIILLTFVISIPIVRQIRRPQAAEEANLKMKEAKSEESTDSNQLGFQIQEKLDEEEP